MIIFMLLSTLVIMSHLREDEDILFNMKNITYEIILKLVICLQIITKVRSQKYRFL